ncbi:hypothetical protein, unlikely [Trypanosoma brucei brucei TREU927]|uniref:Uncharacterized protein n=1 Tax=Trypanosoma brucei brucei (strain 927/4 GUTat10.1) TaxID=185431 RepID=Q38CS4_TRYB2|nr:hypothetical protein, unlikely [Trypanosoma brucei brucei TREU927]EAN77396.1 hypothetical protein, unlikely [Trypanosoma brucei brucei TREU927]
MQGNNLHHTPASTRQPLSNEIITLSPLAYSCFSPLDKKGRYIQLPITFHSQPNMCQKPETSQVQRLFFFCKDKGGTRRHRKHTAFLHTRNRETKGYFISQPNAPHWSHEHLKSSNITAFIDC